MAQRPIGVFDSGVGGLSILRHLRRLLPFEPLIYFADQAHVPYGPRPLPEVRHFSQRIAHFLIDQDAKLIVVACNTASAAALDHLRASYPQVPFVGMEPAVKPAAEATASGSIGVLATPATFQGELFASVVARFAKGVEVHQNTAPGLVERIERGDLNSPTTRELVAEALDPLLAARIDTLVLGCTHYPFIIPLLEELAGPSVRVIDPSPAVARQAHRLLKEHKLAAPGGRPGRVTYLTTGQRQQLANLIPHLIDEDGTVQTAHWSDGQVAILPA